MDGDEELDNSFDEDFFDGYQIWSNFVLEWDRRRRVAAHMVCLVAAYLVKQSEYRNYVDRSIMPNNLERECVSRSKKIDKEQAWKWNEQMDAVLIEAFVHQNDNGNRVNETFTTTTYDKIVLELNERFGYEFNKQLVKNRMKTIKKNFNECYDIFKGDLCGFTWNQETKMMDAEPEVWKALIEVKPEAKKWMSTPLPHYEKLTKLFENDRVIRQGAKTAFEKVKRWNNEMQTGGEMEAGERGKTFIDDIDHMVINDDIYLEGFEGSYDIHEESQPTTPCESVSNKFVTSSQSKKRKTSSSTDYSGIVDSMKEIALAIKEGNEILRERNEILRGRIRETNEILQSTRARVYSEQDVFDELVRLGIDSELLDRAYSFLIEKSGRMRAFFGNPVERRVRYLMTMLKSAGDF